MPLIRSLLQWPSSPAVCQQTQLDISWEEMLEIFLVIHEKRFFPTDVPATS
jgi:hypothetical protein